MNVDIALDRGSPVPLYFQMSQQLQAAIEDGRLAPGDQIDTEMVLAEKYGLSRPTVRQAMQDLVNKGLLMRRRGIGTQVVHSQVRRQLGLTSLYDDLRDSDRRPSTTVLTFDTVAADERVAEVLQIVEGSPVRYLERLRCEGDEPLAYMQNWLPVDIVSPDADLVSGGLYAHLRTTGQSPHTANQRIGAKAATSVEARVLDVRRGAPLLTMERHAFDVTGRPIELGVHAYRADAYAFETNLMER
jgi:DNA-binding GntR family transcriptional regulator